MSKVAKVLRVLVNKRLLEAVMSMPYSGYLKEKGWFESYLDREPKDQNGRPLPWVTYPFISFIEDRLANVESVFEYGSGNSTLYYSRFVPRLDSVEHDLDWFEKVKNTMPSHVNLEFTELSYDGAYSKAVQRSGARYDLIIVDGRDRVSCIKKSLNSLSEGGVIVLDDSERKRYEEGAQFLMSNGFKRIDFWGIAPGLFYDKSTSIFYKKNNVLGL